MAKFVGHLARHLRGCGFAGAVGQAGGHGHMRGIAKYVHNGAAVQLVQQRLRGVEYAHGIDVHNPAKMLRLQIINPFNVVDASAVDQYIKLVYMLRCHVHTGPISNVNTVLDVPFIDDIAILPQRLDDAGTQAASGTGHQCPHSFSFAMVTTTASPTSKPVGFSYPTCKYSQLPLSSMNQPKLSSSVLI